MGVKIEIDYTGHNKCKARHGPSQKEIVLAERPANNDLATDFAPSDLVATALGACATTVMGTLAKQINAEIAGTKIDVIMEINSGPPKRIGSLRTIFTFPAGLKLSEAHKKILEETAKCCPVALSLHPEVRVNMTFNYPSA